ncbi:beta-xylosidase [Chryseolinea sp. H1M3-3]|uniref:GH39 family glycosyl hydrolase n=1 Tax=Chryseolinea sp. H1M3-3 TaxID=3034144 RepID=UPI0023EB4630|nr:beta-xylosidase [Chryseolinea sp. H1M3-3]
MKNINVARGLFLILLNTASLFAQQRSAITVDLSAERGELRPIWSWFGYDEPNYTYMKDGEKLLTELSELSHVPVFVRTHNLLTSGDGKAELKWGSTNAYTQDKKGRPIYNWTIVDSIVDTYIQRKMKPLMEIGFMPEALSTHPKPYKHTWSDGGNLWTGWTYPPKDYKKWEELIFQWVKHSIDRYGLEEVKTWYWETWNEPNIKYWSGTFEEFCKLYDYAAQGVKRACADCKFGGPHTTNPNSPAAEKYLRDFLSHCASGKNYATGTIGSPIDFIAFHAKGNPSVVDGHIRMDMSPQLKAISVGFQTITSFDAFKNLPVIIGECDPEGCAACSMEKNPQNGYRNGTMYSSYTASSYARIFDLAAQHKVNLIGAVTWAFEFENQRWFDGFRDLTTNGVDKPVLNVFRMFGLMPQTRLEVGNDGHFTADQIIAQGVRGNKTDIHGIASKSDREVAVMLWNYHDDDLQTSPATIDLILKNIPAKKVRIHHYRIDEHHSNAYEAWKKIGSPQQVTAQQYNALEKAGQLQLFTSPVWKEISAGTTTLTVELPRQSVSLVKLEW